MTIQSIILEQNGQHITISDEHIRLLGGDITVRRIVGTGNNCHGYCIQKEPYSLLHSPNGYRIPNAGIAPLLASLAAARGINKLQVIVSPSIKSLPAPSCMYCLGYPSLANFAHQHERGLIRIPVGFDSTIIVGELAVAYPRQRIVILGNKVNELEIIVNKLKPYINKNVQLVCGTRPLQINEENEDVILPRIICSTYLEASTIGLASSDLVLILDATNSIHDRAQAALEQIDAQFRLFGIVRTGRKTSPLEGGCIMGVFGPEIIDLLPFRQVRRQAHVAWVSNYQPPVQLKRESVQFDHKCCWHNERRNRMIAQVAKAVVTGSIKNNRDTRDISIWLHERKSAPQSVKILVDRLDHAVTLGKKLLDWPIVTEKKVSLYGYPGSVRNRLRRDRKSWLDGRRMIVLADAKYRFSENKPDVIIWAGSGPHSDCIPDCWLTEPSDSNQSLLIIDFLDRFNHQTKMWSESRETSYAKRDIFEVGVDPAQGRIKLFLDAQQRGNR